ncbi:MAG: hypothetical protein K1W17_04180 [Oscillospiraceae bacterium]
MKKVVNGAVLNKNEAKKGMLLHEIVFTPKGEKEKISVYVYAKNRLDASNWLILNHIWGKQHEVIICNVNLMN